MAEAFASIFHVNVNLELIILFLKMMILINNEVILNSMIITYDYFLLVLEETNCEIDYKDFVIEQKIKDTNDKKPNFIKDYLLSFIICFLIAYFFED